MSSNFFYFVNFEYCSFGSSCFDSRDTQQLTDYSACLAHLIAAQLAVPKLVFGLSKRNDVVPVD